MNKAVVSWSGGKDCCQSAYLAQKEGYQVQYLLNMVNKKVDRSCSHGIAAHWIKLQAEALGIPVVQPETIGEDYRQIFIETLLMLKKDGVTHAVFGDIDFNPHREWIEGVCQSAGVTPILPLWLKDQGKIARDFIKAGFEPVIVATRCDILGPEWLARRFDTTFLQDLVALNKNITPCGEVGEFHSLVIDGPLFKKRLEIREADKIRREDHWILDIRKIDLVEK